MRKIPAQRVMEMVTGDGEVAFLDLREAGPFSEGHPLFAVPCPWSGFETEVERLVPRKSLPVILIDAGDGVADMAAGTLERMGFTEVSVVEGGAAGWAAAGFTLFKGVFVPSKTLGELAEEAMHPRAVAPETLAEWMAQGREFLFYDCRPASEHARMSVPGAVCLANGELPHRLDTLPPGQPIVVTCAGRTRGIVGAASLSMIAPEREVYWLEDGTQGWVLAGYDLSRGNAPDALPLLDEASVAATRARGRSLAARHDLETVTVDAVTAYSRDAARTTYCFDVRSPGEAAEDPIPGFTPVPVVDLVQATDRHVAVRNARIVLADDHGLRGALAGFWLRALGYEVQIVPVSDALRRHAPRPSAQSAFPQMQRVAAAEALGRVAAGRARLVDLRHSGDFAREHVRGASWSIRPRLTALPAAPPALILVGDGTARADLAGATLVELGRTDVAVVEGGMPALIAAGAEICAGRPMDLAEACDVTSFAHGRHDGDRDASRLYLSWEKGLVGQLSAAERAVFRI